MMKIRTANVWAEVDSKGSIMAMHYDAEILTVDQNMQLPNGNYVYYEDIAE